MEVYNDGVVVLKKKVEEKIDFSNKEKPTTNYQEVCSLRYEEKSKRIQDSQFIDAMGHTLSLKIKTRLCTCENITEYKAFIQDNEYSIIHVDTDKKNKDLYFYLERVGI